MLVDWLVFFFAACYLGVSVVDATMLCHCLLHQLQHLHQLHQLLNGDFSIGLIVAATSMQPTAAVATATTNAFDSSYLCLNRQISQR